MDVTILEDWIASNPALALGATVIVLVLIYLISRLIFGRGLSALAGITKNKYDDILVKISKEGNMLILSSSPDQLNRGVDNLMQIYRFGIKVYTAGLCP